MKLFLDDKRTPPAGWTLVRTAKEAIFLLETGFVEEFSLDHDLGTKKSGNTVLCWVERQVFDENIEFTPPTMCCHSANSPGRDNILAGIRRINREWERQQVLE